jgi:hypothetical protein
MDELPSAHDYKHIIGWRRVKTEDRGPKTEDRRR